MGMGSLYAIRSYFWVAKKSAGLWYFANIKDLEINFILVFPAFTIELLQIYQPDK